MDRQGNHDATLAAAARARAAFRRAPVAAAALSANPGSAADPVRQVHRAVLAASGDELSDDATVVCLAIA